MIIKIEKLYFLHLINKVNLIIVLYQKDHWLKIQDIVIMIVICHFLIFIGKIILGKMTRIIWAWLYLGK
jgi:hypothetical protein